MVSFLKKLFGRDPGQCMEKGEAMLQQHRYAEARSFFSEGLQLTDGMTDELKQVLEKNLHVASNALAEMNVSEAEVMKNIDPDRAQEHLHLAVTLAEDGAIREKAERLLKTFAPKVEAPKEHKHGHSCTGCGSHHGQKAENPPEVHHYLNEDEQFELLVSSLPGDLPGRYLNVGKEFADAYMIAHAGEDSKALGILEKLSSAEAEDILCYERAVLYHRMGNPAVAEKLLRQAMQGRSYNPLAHMTFAELMIEAGRLGEAIPVLEDLWSRETLAEQAALILGDIHQHLGATDTALDWYGRLLKGPAAKDAAKRIVPLLMSCQRVPEAEFIAKNYLKCC